MYGTSGGALTGCLLFLDIDLDALAEYVYICAAKARSSWRGAFRLREYCRGAITQFCTRDAHKILQGRFEISITRIFPWYKNLRVNQFPSYDFLVRSLLCSACIVPLAGMPMWLPGFGLCLDGGLSDLQLFKGLAQDGTFCKLHCRKTNPKNIVVVCPFYSSRADIRPSKYVPMWWAFFPPEPYKLKELYELGRKDAHTWADKQEDDGSPDGSPRSARGSAGGRSSDDSDEEWEWRRREKAAIAAAADGAAAGAAAWRASGPESDSRWWTYGARQNRPPRRDRERRSGAGGRGDEADAGPPRASSVTPESSAEATGRKSSGTFTEWAESAARAVKIAARNADQFVHHEAEVAFEYASKGFCEAATAAEAMRRVASRQFRDGREAEWASMRRRRGGRRGGDASGAAAGGERGEGAPARKSFYPHRAPLRLLACVAVLFELLAFACAHALLGYATFSKPRRERARRFAAPAPRVLAQAIPFAPRSAQIDEDTAGALGNISVTYRVLCYLVHLEMRE